MSTPVYKKIIEVLDTHGCAYTTQHHEPTLTSADSARVRGVSMHAGAKAIVAKGNKTGANYLFIMPADYKLWSSQAKNACGEPVSFATNPEEVTDCVPGSVPPFGSLFGLKTFVDPHLAENEIIHFNAGLLTDSVSMPYQAYIEIEKPIIAEIAKPSEG
ncbi:hypothetical protein HQ487_04160 [Candidatus Uhrbacteria bacterium]|nr:hypothetical protein [Candidatus Uhrbacteria bacterium]